MCVTCVFTLLLRDWYEIWALSKKKETTLSGCPNCGIFTFISLWFFSDEGVAAGRRWRHSLEDLVTVVPPMGASTSGCPDQGPASQLWAWWPPPPPPPPSPQTSWTPPPCHTSYPNYMHSSSPMVRSNIHNVIAAVFFSFLNYIRMKWVHNSINTGHCW